MPSRDGQRRREVSARPALTRRHAYRAGGAAAILDLRPQPVPYGRRFRVGVFSENPGGAWDSTPSVPRKARCGARRILDSRSATRRTTACSS